MKNKQAITEAIQTLITEGRKSFREDVEIEPCKCIGMALASQIDFDHGALEIAATILENWNAHIEAGILRKMKVGDFKYDKVTKIVEIDLNK